MKHIIRKSFTAAMLAVACGNVAHAQGTITTIAGNGLSGFGGDGGPAVGAVFSSPSGVALDASGNIFVVDKYNYRVRKITASTGVISTYAGGGTGTAYGVDATTAMFEMPYSIFINSANDVFVTDHYFDMTFRIDNATHAIYSRCGSHTQGCDGDGGTGDGARMMLPAASCEDGAGNTYIADQGCGKIRRVDGATGIVSTLASLSGVNAVFFDPTTTTDLYVAQMYTHQILKLNVATGVTTVVAGTGVAGNTGNVGYAINATIGTPAAIFVDNHHGLYFTDNTYSVVRKINLTTGQIYNIAGTGVAGYSGDGGVSPYAELSYPSGIWVDNAGYIYVADEGNNVIRKIKPKAPKANGAIAGANEISVYPNPTSGVFTLFTDEELENTNVTVFNVVGQQVYSTVLSGNSNNIDLGQQAPGLYTVAFKTASGMHTERVTIQ